MCTLWGPGELCPHEGKLPAPFPRGASKPGLVFGLPRRLVTVGTVMIQGGRPPSPAWQALLSPPWTGLGPGPVTHGLRTLVASPQMSLQVTKYRRGHSIDWVTTTHPDPTDVPGTVLPRGLQRRVTSGCKVGQWEGLWETVSLKEGPEVIDCAPFPRIHLPGENTNWAFTPNLFVSGHNCGNRRGRRVGVLRKCVIRDAPAAEK